MKKLLAILLTAALLLSCSAAFAETTDATTSASVADYYGDYALTGDDLMNAGGFRVKSTRVPGLFPARETAQRRHHRGGGHARRLQSVDESVHAFAPVCNSFSIMPAMVATALALSGSWWAR